MNRPNFFIVGAPRSGTSAMYLLLSEHPEIFMSRPKEPYFFCTDFHAESDRYHRRRIRFPIRTGEQYLELFADAEDARIIGEATPDYLYSSAAAGHIFRFNPDARILIMVRNPVDFLRSLHAKLIMYGHETVSDLGQALQVEEARRAGRSLPKSLFWPSSLYYSERIRFTEQINRYRSYFPESQIKVVVYDDFREDNSGIYAEVLRFLGVAADFRPRFRLSNVHRTPRYPVFNRIAMAIGDLPIAGWLPFKLRKSLRRMLRHLNSTTSDPGLLDPELRSSLMQKTRPEVKRLGRLLNRDLLELWGYDPTEKDSVRFSKQ